MIKIIGDVSVAEHSSIWYNSVVRGDVHYIKIGHTTNIQDCSMLHVTNGKFPLNIGNFVTIGHSVKLHGCVVEDLSFLGWTRPGMGYSRPRRRAMIIFMISFEPA